MKMYFHANYRVIYRDKEDEQHISLLPTVTPFNDSDDLMVVKQWSWRNACDAAIDFCKAANYNLISISIKEV